jgi:DNA-binding NarL/FixJ family response regulator
MTTAAPPEREGGRRTSVEATERDDGASRGEGCPLSERRREIMELIAGGMATKEVARHFDPPCSPETVKTHLKAIYLQLGVKNRAEAAAV